MSISKQTRTSLGLVALVAAGWISYRGAVAIAGPSFSSVADAHRDRIEAQVRHLPAIARQVQALPPLEEDRVNHSGAPLMMSHDEFSNVTVLHAEDLAVTDQLGFVAYRLSSRTLNECAALVRQGHDPIDTTNPGAALSTPYGEYAAHLFKVCEAARTLLVVRTAEYLRPTDAVEADAGFVPDLTVCAEGADAGTVPTTPEDRYVFAGGEIKAEILVFDLESGRYEGGYRVHVRSLPRERQAWPAQNLVDALRDAARDGLERYVPGSRVVR